MWELLTGQEPYAGCTVGAQQMPACAHPGFMIQHTSLSHICGESCSTSRFSDECWFEMAAQGHALSLADDGSVVGLFVA